MSLSLVNWSNPSWLIILLTVLPAPNLILVKLTSPAYTLHCAGLEYLWGEKAVKHKELQSLCFVMFCFVFVFFLKCPYKDKYVQTMNEAQVLTSGHSVQQIGSRKGQWWSLHKRDVLKSGDWPAMARHRLLQLYRQQYGSWVLMNFLHILRMQGKEVNFTHPSSVNPCTGLRRMKTGIANPSQVWQVDRHSHAHFT